MNFEFISVTGMEAEVLILSRSKYEEIVIGKAGDVLDGPIVVSVVELRPTRARIGIAAQRGIDVHRKEIAELIEETRADRKPVDRTEDEG